MKLYSKGTFGGSKAADVIDGILLELQDPGITKRVAWYITHVDTGIKHLRDIRHVGFRNATIQKHMQEYRNMALKDPMLPLTIRTHLANHLTAMVRKVTQQTPSTFKCCSGGEPDEACGTCQ